MFSLEAAIKKLISDAIVDAYDRIKDGETEIQPTDGKPEEIKSVQNTTKRKRRTKAEIEAAARAETEEALGVVDKPIAQPQQKDVKPADFKQVSYDELKEVVLSYVLDNGKPAAEKILSQFGVTQAQKLQPEQYAECLELFKAAMEAEDEIA